MRLRGFFSQQRGDPNHERLETSCCFNIQGLRSRAAGRRPLRLRNEEWTFSRKAEKKHKWRNWRLENAKRSIYSTTVQDRDDYDYEFVIVIHSPSP